MITTRYDADSWSLLFVDADLDLPNPFDGELNVFFCGALQDPARVRELLSHPVAFAPAVAMGYLRRIDDIDGSPTSFMVEDTNDPNRALIGAVYLGLTRADLERIEVVEQAGDLRECVEIQVRVGERVVAAVTFIKHEAVRFPRSQR